MSAPGPKEHISLQNHNNSFLVLSVKNVCALFNKNDEKVLALVSVDSALVCAYMFMCSEARGQPLVLLVRCCASFFLCHSL